MSEVAKLKEQIAKSREDLKAAFESQEDGKYTAEAKEKIKGYNTELAGLVDDLKLEEAKVKNEKALEVDNEPVNSIPNAMPEAEEGPKSIGSQFAESDAYKAYTEKGVKGVDSHAEFKTTLNTTGYPPEQSLIHI